MTVCHETVVLRGHIIDSLILAKVLDTILMMGGTFDLEDVRIGVRREEPSSAKIVVKAQSLQALGEILKAIQPRRKPSRTAPWSRLPLMACCRSSFTPPVICRLKSA